MWTSCHLTSKQWFLWLSHCSFLFKTTHSLSLRNKTNVKSFKKSTNYRLMLSRKFWHAFQNSQIPQWPQPHNQTKQNPPKKLYIITVFFFLAFMCIAFSLRANGRHEVAVIYRDEYFGLKLSPPSPTILHPSHSSRIV